MGREKEGERRERKGEDRTGRGKGVKEDEEKGPESSSPDTRKH